MDRYETGMLARSKAGHDAGPIYVLIDTDSAYVYLVDGQIRTLDRPKKKKKKHVQIILEKYEIADADDVAIKRILKVRNKDAKKQEE